MMKVEHCWPDERRTAKLTLPTYDALAAELAALREETAELSSEVTEALALERAELADEARDDAEDIAADSTMGQDSV